MGGRGASSATRKAIGQDASPIVAGEPVHVYRERHSSTNGFGSGVVLQATADGSDVVLDYAEPSRYEHPNRNTTEYHYELDAGIVAGIPGHRSAEAINLDLSKATSVSGRTYDVQGLLKSNGFKWDRERKRYVRAH